MPSTRFRVTQHMARWEAEGLQIDHFPARFGAYPQEGALRRAAWLPAALVDALRRAFCARASDVCLLQRELVSTLRTAEPLILRPIVFDVDDAIYLHPRGAQSDAIARGARIVVCGNRVLAEHYGSFASVTIVPTAVDTERFTPPSTVRAEAPVIGWSGTSSGFSYLDIIQPALVQVFRLHPAARFVVMAERAPQLRDLPADRVQFVPWSEQGEVAALQSFSVGVMPLTDDAWARGKCSLKMLTYMACGVPVVVSPVGMNVDVLRTGELGFGANSVDDWTQALDTLLREPDQAARMGRTGRAVAVAQFSCEVIAPRLAAIMRQAAA